MHQIKMHLEEQMIWCMGKSMMQYDVWDRWVTWPLKRLTCDFHSGHIIKISNLYCIQKYCVLYNNCTYFYIENPNERKVLINIFYI